MADGNDSGGTTMIALVVGALLVLVIGLYAGGIFNKQDSTTVTVESPVSSTPSVPDQPSTTPPEASPTAPQSEPAPETPTTTPEAPSTPEPAPATPPAQ